MKPYAFGIDIGGTTVKIGFFETTGTLLKKWEIPTRTDDGGSQILTDIAEAVKAELAEREIGAEDIEGIGMGIVPARGMDAQQLIPVSLVHRPAPAAAHA